jgi:hypothetical protein
MKKTLSAQILNSLATLAVATGILVTACAPTKAVMNRKSQSSKSSSATSTLPTRLSIAQVQVDTRPDYTTGVTVTMPYGVPARAVYVDVCELSTGTCQAAAGFYLDGTQFYIPGKRGSSVRSNSGYGSGDLHPHISARRRCWRRKSIR